MAIAILVGMLSGIVGTACLLLTRVILNTPAVYNQLGGSWYLMPPLIGLFAAGAHSAARAISAAKASRPLEPVSSASDRRTSLSDLFESYYFGVFVLQPVNWLARALVSLAGVLFGGIFGLEGAVVELSYASLPLFSRYLRLFIQEKQTFVICAMSASFGVALGAPFTGALLALELPQVLDARVRGGAVLASLVAYGTATLLQSMVMPGVFSETSAEHLNVMGALFTGLRPMSFELSHWLAMSVVAILVGVCCAILAACSVQALARARESYLQLFAGKTSYGMIVTGLLVGLTVLLVPDIFGEPGRRWEDLAWAKLSTPMAASSLVTHWVLLVLAFAGWGTAGLITPMLALGALLGYAVGNSVGSAWAIPLAIAGAASTLSASFRVPLASAALVLEIGHDGPMWWLATISVVFAALTSRFLRARPLHELLLERQGLRVVNGRVASVLSAITTHEAMYRDVGTISDKASLEEMRAAAKSSHHNFLGVISIEGKYLGLLALEQLPSRIRRVLHEDVSDADVRAVDRVVEIRDLIDTYSPTVSPGDSLEKALGLLQQAPCIAVVDEQRNLCGLLFETSIAGRYKREIANTVIRRG